MAQIITSTAELSITVLSNLRTELLLCCWRISGRVPLDLEHWLEIFLVEILMNITKYSLKDFVEGLSISEQTTLVGLDKSVRNYLSLHLPP